MPTEYYIWKWAENDLPGQPAEILTQLATGDLPPALEQFLVRKLYPRLARVLDQWRSELSEIFVDPPVTLPGAARFIRLRHPLGDPEGLANQLLWAVWEAELTVYNATANRLIGLPKRNVVELPGGRQLLDIERADIPGLLHRLAKRPVWRRSPVTTGTAICSKFGRISAGMPSSGRSYQSGISTGIEFGLPVVRSRRSAGPDLDRWRAGWICFPGNCWECPRYIVFGRPF